MKNGFVSSKMVFVITVIGVLLVSWSLLIDVFQGNKNGFGFIQTGAAVLGAILILFVWSAYSQKVHFYFGEILSLVTMCFLGLGILLTLINLSGIFIPLRQSVVNEGIDFLGRFSIPKLSVKDVVKVQDKRPDETVREYAYRLTDLVNQATIQLPDERLNYPQYELGVPIYENYFFWLFKYTRPGNYGYYQYCDSSKALERGVTTCGQATRIVKYIWLENGLEARRVTLDGHIIIEVQVDQSNKIWWVLDPLFDVVLEHDVKSLARHPEFVVDAYEKAGYSEVDSMKMADTFASPGNYVITEKNYCSVEQKYYFYKWALPLMMVVPFGVMKFFSRKRAR